MIAIKSRSVNSVVSSSAQARRNVCCNLCYGLRERLRRVDVDVSISMLQFSFENLMLRLERRSVLARAHDSCKAAICEYDAAS